MLTTASHGWDTEEGTLHNDAWPLQLAFHSYDPVMAVTDDTDNIWSAEKTSHMNQADEQSLGLEVPHQDEQVQQHECRWQQYIEYTFHQRDGHIAHAHCLK